jgi:hypothetical protein
VQTGNAKCFKKYAELEEAGKMNEDIWLICQITEMIELMKEQKKRSRSISILIKA